MADRYGAFILWGETMNPNYIHTITLFNCLKASDSLEKKEDIWYRTILHECFYKATIERVESGGMLGMDNAYTVRIPESDRYLPYREWAALSEKERSAYFTIHMDDIILYAERTDEEVSRSAGRTAAEVIRRNKPDAFRVKAFSDNTGFPVDGHYRLGG